jgi:hypothetical protein
MVSYAEIADRFTKQSVDALQQTSKHKADRLLLSTDLQSPDHREFHVVDKNGWSGSLSEYDSMPLAFDTGDMGDLINKVVTSESTGSTGDVMSAFMQGDMLACQKRAFMDRHRGWVRRACHAGARQAAQRQDSGIHRRNVLGYLEDFLKSIKTE